MTGSDHTPAITPPTRSTARFWQRLRTRRRRLLWFALPPAALVISLGSAWLWQSDSEPSYCWGAWDAEVIGHTKVTETEAAPPTSEHAQGVCTIEMRDQRITVTYDGPPSEPEERLDWFTNYVGSDTGPLPEDLPGLVGGERGLVVLPESCAVDSESRVLTIERDAVRPSPVSNQNGVYLGGLMLKAANHGMAEADCLPDDHDWQYRDGLGNFTPAYERKEWEPDQFCRVPGIPYGNDHRVMHLSFHRDELQACSLSLSDRDTHQPRFLLLMVGSPALAGLFDDVPRTDTLPDSWQGKGFVTDSAALLRITCDNQPVVFLRSGSIDTQDEPLAAFSESAAQRIGCPVPTAEGS